MCPAQESRPKTIILDKATFPVDQLLRYDVIICSHNFLRTRYIEYLQYQRRMAFANWLSVTSADEILGQARPGTLDRIAAPLHSPLYGLRAAPICVLIVNKSQIAKNPDSQLNEAFRALEYLFAFLLSGTPIHNQWFDLYGQMALLPGCPFIDAQHFYDVFAHWAPVQSGNNKGKGKAKRTSKEKLDRRVLFRLTEAHMALVRQLLSGILVSRPKDVYQLPPVKEATVQVDFGAYRALVADIEKDVRIAKWLL
jgi:hypothetical protein